MGDEKHDLALVLKKECPECGNGYEPDTARCPADNSLLYPVKVTSTLVGQTIAGNYQIQAQIGEGAWSTVYKAHQPRLDRTVAIKVLMETLASQPEHTKRFEREAMLISKLTHSNLVTVYDYGILADGRPYIVMEHVEGTNLSALLQQKGKLQWREALHILIAAARGIQNVHDAGVLHRDIKPSNILICGDALSVKVVDFGLAKSVDANSNASLTETGHTIGTPAYMSPELCLGRSVDVRSDIYSFGCVMYEALTGKQVFTGNSIFESMQMHLNQQPMPFAAVGAGDVPGYLEAVTFRCLAKEPEYRYSSMSKLISELTSVRDGSAGTLIPINERRARWLVPLRNIFRSSLWQVGAVVGLLCLSGAFAWRHLHATSSGQIAAEKTANTQSGSISASDGHHLADTEDDITLLKRQFARIDKQIATLNASGAGAEAKRMQSQLDEYKALWNGPFFRSAQARPELHVVSLYTGAGKARAGGEARAKVRVTDRDSLVRLALTSCEPVIWDIQLDPGVKLQQVYLAGGEFPQKIEGISESSYRVNKAPTWSGSQMVPNHYSYSKLQAEHDSVADRLLALTRLPVSTFQGLYSPPDEQGIFVGPQNKRWCAQELVNAMAPFYKQSLRLDQIKFDAVSSADGADSQTESALASFNIGGPLEATILTLPRTAQKDKVRGAVKEPGGKRTFAFTDHYFGELVDGKFKQIASVDFVNGITYDTKRSLVTVAARRNGTEGIFAYNPKTDGWQQLALLKAVPWQGIAYSAADDCYYALALGLLNRHNLYVYSPEGNLVKTISLKDTGLPSDRGCRRGGQLVDCGKYLAAITGMGEADKVRYLEFVIEKASGECVSSVLPSPQR